MIFLRVLHEDYTHLVRHIVPGPETLSYFVPFLLLPTALLVPPSVLSHTQLGLLFMPPIYISLLHSWYASGGWDVISFNAGLWSTYLLVFKDPRRTFRRRISSTKVKVDDIPSFLEQAFPRFFPSRLRWVSELLISIRLQDWLTGDRSHDEAQSRLSISEVADFNCLKRDQFITMALARAMRGLMVLIFTAQFTNVDPYFTEPQVSMLSPLPSVTFAYSPSLFPPIRPDPCSSPLVPALPDPPFYMYLVRWYIRAMVTGLQAHALIAELYYPACILPVLLNGWGLLPTRWSPHYSEPHIGNLESVADHGIRGLWGSYWHQMMRITVSAPGYWVADNLLGLGGSENNDATVLGNKAARSYTTGPGWSASMQSPTQGSRQPRSARQRRSFWRYAIVTFSSFFFSGVVHAGMVPPEPLHATVSSITLKLYIFAFFFSQICAIMAESLMGLAIGRFRPGLFAGSAGQFSRKVITVIWVLLWLGICLPLVGETGRQLGWFRAWMWFGDFVQGLADRLHGYQCISYIARL